MKYFTLFLLFSFSVTIKAEEHYKQPKVEMAAKTHKAKKLRKVKLNEELNYKVESADRGPSSEELELLKEEPHYLKRKKQAPPMKNNQYTQRRARHWRFDR